MLRWENRFSMVLNNTEDTKSCHCPPAHGERANAERGRGREGGSRGKKEREGEGGRPEALNEWTVC